MNTNTYKISSSRDFINNKFLTKSQILRSKKLDEKVLDALHNEQKEQLSLDEQHFLASDDAKKSKYFVEDEIDDGIHWRRFKDENGIFVDIATGMDNDEDFVEQDKCKSSVIRNKYKQIKSDNEESIDTIKKFKYLINNNYTGAKQILEKLVDFSSENNAKHLLSVAFSEVYTDYFISQFWKMYYREFDHIISKNSEEVNKNSPKIIDSKNINKILNKSNMLKSKICKSNLEFDNKQDALNMTASSISSLCDTINSLSEATKIYNDASSNAGKKMQEIVSNLMNQLKEINECYAYMSGKKPDDLEMQNEDFVEQSKFNKLKAELNKMKSELNANSEPNKCNKIKKAIVFNKASKNLKSDYSDQYDDYYEDPDVIDDITKEFYDKTQDDYSNLLSEQKIIDNKQNNYNYKQNNYEDDYGEESTASVIKK